MQKEPFRLKRREVALQVDQQLRWQVDHQVKSLIEKDQQISQLQQALYAALTLLAKLGQ